MTWFIKNCEISSYILIVKIKNILNQVTDSGNKSCFTFPVQCLLLLSLYTLCKESIVKVKNFDFEIFIYLYVWGLLNSFMLFLMWCMGICVCMWVNTIVSKRCIRLRSNLVCILRVTVEQTLFPLMMSDV